MNDAVTINEVVETVTIQGEDTTLTITEEAVEVVSVGIQGPAGPQGTSGDGGDGKLPVSGDTAGDIYVDYIGGKTDANVDFDVNANFLGTLKVNDVDVATVDDLTGGAGGFTGPTSSTNNAMPRFDGITGDKVKDSAMTVDDDGNLRFNGWRLSFSTGSLTIASPNNANLVDLSNYADTATFINFRTTSKYGGAVAAVVKGSSGQTAALVEFKSSSDAALSWIDADGNFCTKSPDGTAYKITVANGGTLTATEI